MSLGTFFVKVIRNMARSDRIFNGFTKIYNGSYSYNFRKPNEMDSRLLDQLAKFKIPCTDFDHDAAGYLPAAGQYCRRITGQFAHEMSKI